MSRTVFFFNPSNPICVQTNYLPEQFYFHFISNILLRTDLTFGVADTVFRIASEMRRLAAYFNNPDETRRKFAG